LEFDTGNSLPDETVDNDVMAPEDAIALWDPVVRSSAPANAATSP
jgi:hypothetical protein